MKIQGGKLFIDDEKYEKPITTPTPREMLYPDRYTQSTSTGIQVYRGQDVTHECSKFIGYAAPTKDLDEVQAAYLKIKKKHAEATHIACAYRILGDDEITSQDFVDDGEYGAGCTMLKWLKDKKTTWNSNLYGSILRR